MGCFVVLLFSHFVECISNANNKTTRQQNNQPRFGWKPIPSEARVTRDEVSGLPIMNVELSGRQYPIDALTRLWLTRHVQNQSHITHD